MSLTTHPAVVSRAEAVAGRTALRRSLYALSCIAMDLGVLCLSFFVALGIRAQLSHLVGPLPRLHALHWPEPLGLYASGVLITMAGFVYEGMYSTGLAILDRTERLVKSLSWSFFLLILISFTVQETASISRLALSLCYVVTMVLMVLARPLWEQRLLRAFRVPSGLNLLGGVELSNDTRQQLCGHGIAVFGEIGLAPPEVPLASSAFVSSTSDLAEQHLAELETRYQELGIVPPVEHLSPLGSQPVNLRGLQIFVISHPLRRRFNRFTKRAMDLAGGILLLLLSLPLALIIAALIRMESRGPLFFAQRRLGRGGRPFFIYKFRTMVCDAEVRLAAVLAANPDLKAEYLETGKLKSDPRITRMGRWLRRYSLDELPQFWNVLIGDMSLVGPRPFCFDHERDLLGSAYSIISTVRPGITGIWQTSGRSNAAYSSRRDFDVYYVRSWSIWLDMALLVKTLRAVLLPGAY